MSITSNQRQHLIFYRTENTDYDTAQCTVYWPKAKYFSSMNNFDGDRKSIPILTHQHRVYTDERREVIGQRCQDGAERDQNRANQNGLPSSQSRDHNIHDIQTCSTHDQASGRGPIQKSFSSISSLFFYFYILIIYDNRHQDARIHSFIQKFSLKKCIGLSSSW